MPFGSPKGRAAARKRAAQRATSRALKTNPTTAGVAAKNAAARRFIANKVRSNIARQRSVGGRAFSASGTGAGAPRVPGRGGVRGGGGNFTGGMLEGSILLGGGLGLGPAGGSAKAPTGTTSATMDGFARDLEKKFNHRSSRRRRGS